MYIRKLSNDKRGVTLILKVILGIVLGVISIGLLLAAAGKIFGLFFSEQGKLQANGQLDRIIELSSSLGEGESTSTVLTSPQGWWIISMPGNLNEYEGTKKPNLFFGRGVLCICPKRKIGGINCVKGICKQVSMPFVSYKNGNEINLRMQIQIKNIVITNSTDRFIISEKSVIVKPQELSSGQADTYKDVKDMIESKYGEIIGNVLKKCNVDRRLLVSIIYKESRGNQYAIGTSGEVGLMQLMPETAHDQGLKVYNYDKYEELKKEGKYKVYVNDLKELKNNNHNNLENLKELDDRFDASKNIMAGCKHIKAMLDNNNGDVAIALAAYNWGQGNVNKNCNEDKTSCEIPGTVKSYVSSVLAYYTSMA